jgi:exonuclease SbcD
MIDSHPGGSDAATGGTNPAFNPDTNPPTNPACATDANPGAPLSPPRDKPPGAWRLLHTSDWHLGKLLNDRPRHDEHERFLAWLLDAVREHAVDAVVVAGDVFDVANPPQSALRQYYEFVSALHALGSCALVVVGGNHDSATQLEAPRDVLRALRAHVVGAMAANPAERIILLPHADAPKVAVAALPFLRERDLRTAEAGQDDGDIRKALREGIARRYEETAQALSAMAPGCPAIATGHLTVVSASPSDSERDIHVGGLGAVAAELFPPSFQYVALGHFHRPQAAPGHPHVRYSGSPLPLSFSECADLKSVQIVDVEGASVSNWTLPLPTARHLVRLEVKAASLDADIAAFEPPQAELPTWVEVTVHDAAAHDDLNQRVHKAAEGRAFEVLKIVRAGSAALATMRLHDDDAEDAADALLTDPRAVFARRLAEEAQLSDDERAELSLTFSELLEQINHGNGGNQGDRGNQVHGHIDGPGSVPDSNAETQP